MVAPAAAPIPAPQYIPAPDWRANLSAAEGLRQKSATALATRTAAAPLYPVGLTPGDMGRLTQKALANPAPYVTTGTICRDSDGYSMVRAGLYAQGALPADMCKEEVDVSRRLKSLYGMYSGWAGRNTFLVPIGADLIPTGYTDDVTHGIDPAKRQFVAELREKMFAGAASYVDYDRLEYLQRQGIRFKALGTIDDTAGATFVGPPAVGQFIDLQRNAEITSRLGVTNTPLPQSGQVRFPRLTAAGTAYMIGEAAALTSSQPTTGALHLIAKKMAVLYPFDNELSRFADTLTETLLRMDMAKIAARKVDNESLYGVGGTVHVLGVANYPTQTVWSEGTDKVLAFSPTTIAADGNTMAPQDFYKMAASLPDDVDGNGWLLRKSWFAKYVATQRAGSGFAANDGNGLFLFSPTREAGSKFSGMLNGAPTLLSNGVVNTRTKGSGTNLVTAFYGQWDDMIIARFGVAEFLLNPYGTGYANDQTYLRMIQHFDAGLRHPASFAIADTLLP